MDRPFIERVRSFNRAVTLRTGALNDSYSAAAGRSARRGCCSRSVRRQRHSSLRERLGLDSGYVSRLLKSLEAEGLIAVESDASDRRRRL